MASAKSIAEATGLPVSKETVQRELKRNEYHHERIWISQCLTMEQKKKQLAFAQKHVTKSLADWKKVIFTDEK